MVHLWNWSRRILGARVVVGAIGLAVLAFSPAVSVDAAQAETRTLKVKFVHTGETGTITFKKNGQYIQTGLNQINKILRDFRRNESTKMDPRLLDLVWEVYQQTGSRDYIHVISAYRSPATNGMLRSRGRGVAKNSQHMLGKAMDFFIPGVKLSKLREIGLKMGVGGVGFYPTSGSPFVHLDVGNVRHWPRMSRQELVRIFPDGKTLHVPTDGKPLPRYEQALAEYKRSGRTSSATVASVEETKKPNFFQMLAARAKQDQDDDEGANDAPAAVVSAGQEPSEIKVASARAPASARAAASTQEAPPAPTPAAAVEVPVPEQKPVEIAAAPPPEDDPLAADRVPTPSRRPAYTPVIARVEPEPAAVPAEPVAVAALTPGEIEEIRRLAVPSNPQLPAATGVALPQMAAARIPAPRPAAVLTGAIPQTAPAAPAATETAAVAPAVPKLALLSEPAVRPAPAADPAAASLAAERLAKGMPLPAPRPAIAAPAEAAPAQAAPAAPNVLQGPSQRTLELALAATPKGDAKASRAIRDLIAAGGGTGQQVPGSLNASFAPGAAVAAVPVPERNPRKAGGVAVAQAPVSAPAKVAKIAQVERKPEVEAGRYALTTGAGLEKTSEIKAPGYNVSAAIDERTLVVAGFVQARLQSVRTFGSNPLMPGVRFERQ